MTERKPYPFFASVEFLTVLVKVGTVSTPFLLAIATTGFTIANILALLFSGILTGCMIAAKELEIHQNLYTPSGVAGRNESDAIRLIQINEAKKFAQNSSRTLERVLETVPMRNLVDLAANPSLANAASKLVARLLKGTI